MNNNRKKIKVLFVAGKVGITNGAYHSLLSTVSELKNMGIEPIILLSKHSEAEEGLKASGAKCIVTRYESCTVPADNPSKIKGFVKSLINLAAELRTAGIVKKENIDIIHINVGSASLGAETAIKNDIPLIWHLREFMEEDVNLTYFNKKKTAGLLKSADRVIAISDAVSDFFVKKYGLERISTVYNGISFNDLLPVKKIQPENKIVLALIGRVVPGKGQFEAVKAFKHIIDGGYKRVCLKIVGDVGNEQYYKQITEYINEEGLTDFVEFESHRKDLVPVWREADIGLICSAREGFGRVTAELMLNGVPVVGADTGATPELLKNKRGYTYKYGDEKDLAKSVIYAATHPDRTYAYAQNAKAYAAEEFTSYRCAKKIYDIYAEVLASKGRKVL